MTRWIVCLHWLTNQQGFPAIKQELYECLWTTILCLNKSSSDINPLILTSVSNFSHFSRSSSVKVGHVLEQRTLIIKGYKRCLQYHPCDNYPWYQIIMSRLSNLFGSLIFYLPFGPSNYPFDLVYSLFEALYPSNLYPL